MIMLKNNINKRTHEENIARGAAVNMLGTIGKALHPLFFVLVTRLYGPELMGIYFMIYKILDITASLTVSGINDGMMMFMSRDMEKAAEREDRLYMIIANGLMMSVVVTALIIAAGSFGGLEFLKNKYPQAEVVDSLRYMMWSLPFIFIPVLVISATKALLIMKYDAFLIGFLKPFLMTVFALVFYFISPTLDSLLNGFFISSVILSLLSLVIFHRYFSYGKLWRHLVRFKLFKPLIYFAVPQNLNITFTTFITNLDILLLGYFKFSPELIGFYGMGAQIVKNLREVKLAFSGAYAPIIARLHAAKNYVKMNQTFSMISRWTSMIGFPVALLLALFRDELIRIFHPSFTYGTAFMIILLVPPLISCTIGLSANILVMTGHSGWNLVNSVGSTMLNGVLGYFLIQRYGLTGAATATALSALLVTFVIYYEIQILEKASLIMERIYKPYAAIAIPMFAVIVLEYFNLLDSFLMKSAVAVSAMAVYVVIILMLKMEPEDKRLFSFRKHSNKNAIIN